MLATRIGDEDEPPTRTAVVEHDDLLPVEPRPDVRRVACLHHRREPRHSPPGCRRKPVVAVVTDGLADVVVGRSRSGGRASTATATASTLLVAFSAIARASPP